MTKADGELMTNFTIKIYYSQDKGAAMYYFRAGSYTEQCAWLERLQQHATQKTIAVAPRLPPAFLEALDIKSTEPPPVPGTVVSRVLTMVERQRIANMKKVQHDATEAKRSAAKVCSEAEDAEMRKEEEQRHFERQSAQASKVFACRFNRFCYK